MVGRFLARITEPVRGLHQAAYWLAVLAFLSQLLALARDRLLASTFGASGTLDVYYAAFRIPDFLFATVASLLSLYALMPILSELEAKEPGRMIAFLRQLLVGFFVAMGLVAVAAFILAPWLLHLIVPGFDGDKAGELVMLTRIMLLQPIMLGASNLLANLTQMRDRFVLYAISPLLYNAGIISGVIFLYPLFGLPGLAWGVVLGALLHFLFQLPQFAGEAKESPMPLAETKRLLGQVLTLSIPRTFALASSQVSLMVLTALASFLAAGSIAIFTFAYNLQAVPIAIIGVAYSVAAFPTLSRLFAQGERQKLAEHVETALRHVLFWSIPATVLAIVLRAELVRVILGAGRFNWSATRLTAAAFALFVLSLAAQNVVLLIARTYYASGNSRKPLYYGLINIAVSVGSALGLVALFHSSAGLRFFVEALLRVDSLPGTTVLMLALGYALGSVLQAIVGYIFFVRDFGIKQKEIGRLALQSLGASLIGGAAAYYVLGFMDDELLSSTLGVLVTGAAGGLTGIAVIGAMLWAQSNRELSEIWRALHSRLAPAARPVLETTDIGA